MEDKNFYDNISSPTESKSNEPISQQDLTESNKNHTRYLLLTLFILFVILAVLVTFLYLNKDVGLVVEEEVTEDVQVYEDPDIEEQIFHISQLDEFLDFRDLSYLSDDARLISREKTDVLTVVFSNEKEVTFGSIPLVSCRPVTESGAFDETEGYSFCLEQPFVISAKPNEFSNQFTYLGGSMGITRSCAETLDEIENDCVKERLINRLTYSISEKFDAILYSEWEHFTEEMKEEAILAQEEFKEMESEVRIEEFNLLHYKVGSSPNELGSFTIVTDHNDNIISLIRLGIILPL
jgi:hypothetical protein